MSNYDRIIQISSKIERAQIEKIPQTERSLHEYFALAITTFGIGYIPLIPGTVASLFAVGIYVLITLAELKLLEIFLAREYKRDLIWAWLHFFNLLFFLGFSLLSVWASSVAVRIFRNKDPKQAVVDEIIGQLITFLFIPFTLSWEVILAGFVFFRVFDIWKPYPINTLQNLPAGVGVCADDVLAGVYAGVALSFFYALTL